MEDIFIVSAVRTPLGKFGGALASHSPVDLAAHAMKSVLTAANVDGAELDLYIFGNVLGAGHGQLIPRQAALKAGIPDNVDGVSLDMVCSSGMMSIMQASALIRAGDAGLVLAGGVESMSDVGFYLSSRARWGYKFLMGKPEQVKDLLLYDGLTDPTTDEAMGAQAERLAAENGVTREEVDEVAAESHRRASSAWTSGAFEHEVTPIEYRHKKEARMLEQDEGIRSDTTVESLSSLRTAFGVDGILTAGNSSQISDGASAILLANRATVGRLDLQPIAKLMGGTWSAGETWRFPEAPIPAVRKLLQKTNLKIEDFDLFENNEAFALNSILFHRMLGVDLDTLNVHGGAVALGHPIGCSGARIVTTLVHALATRDADKGLAAICHGTGGGTSVAIERV
ncbi:MAG: thiolase family protein [Bacteroidetes bacterium]|nr:thiolase family protein [Bacteroidota bacterium]